VSLTTGQAAPRSVSPIAYITHLNPLVKTLLRSPNAAVLDLTLRDHKDGHVPPGVDYSGSNTTLTCLKP